MKYRHQVLRETTPSSMVASPFKYNTQQLPSEEFSLAQWLWYLLVVHEVTGSNPAWTLYSSHAFIHFFLFDTDFVRKTRLWTESTERQRDDVIGLPTF